MRSNECLDITARSSCLSSVKGENGFLPPIKEKCCSQPNELECKPALSCREAAQREYSRREPIQHRKESLFRADSPSLPLALHRSLEMRPSKLPDIDRSKCGSVGSMISVTPSSRGSKASITMSNRLAMCKSPSCPQFDSWSDFNDSIQGYDNDVNSDVHTYSQTTRLKPVMDNVKLPEIVSARDNGVHEAVRKPMSQRLAEATSRKMASESLTQDCHPDHEEFSYRLDNEPTKQVTPRTHGNTLLPIKINGVRKMKKSTKKEASKYWRPSDVLSSGNANDLTSAAEEGDYQTYQLSRSSAMTTKRTEADGQDDSEYQEQPIPVSDSQSGSGLAQASSYSVDGAIEKIAQENCVGKNIWK